MECHPFFSVQLTIESSLDHCAHTLARVQPFLFSHLHQRFMRGAHSSSEPVLASSLTSVGPSDQDGMPSAVGLCLDRARSLSTPGSEQDDSQLAASDYEGWRVSTNSGWLAHRMRARFDADASSLLQERHPCLLTNFEEFRQQLHGRRLAVFLDYDGE